MEDIVKSILSPKLILSIAVAAVAVALFFVVKKLDKKFTGRNASTAVEGVVFGILRFLIILIAVLWILQINGINVSTVAAGLGIASAIVGLALQNYLQDLIMGIRLLSDSFFKVGDVVEYSSSECEVISFNLQSTKLRDLDNGSVISVCNRNITEIKTVGEIMNINIPISYKEDTRRIHSVFKSAAEELGSIDGIVSCEYKGTQSFEDSSILYRFDVRCDRKMRPDIRRSVLNKIHDILDREKIEIPFNQLDVHCDMAVETEQVK